MSFFILSYQPNKITKKYMHRTEKYLDQLTRKIVHFRLLLSVYTVKNNKRDVGRIELNPRGSLVYYKNFIKRLQLKSKVVSNASNYFIYFSKKKGFIEQVIAAHQHGDNYILGKLYGYPKCCILAWDNESNFKKNKIYVDHCQKNNLIAKTHDSLSMALHNLPKRNPAYLHRHNNFFSGHKLIIHNAHSLNCRKSVDIAKENEQIIKNENRLLWKSALCYLHGVVLVSNQHCLIVNNCRLNKNYLLFKMCLKKFWFDNLFSFRVSKNNYKIPIDNSGKINILLFTL